jgi:hypothetical protein
VAISGGSGNFSTSSSTFVQPTNLSVTLTTSGRPVMVMVIPDSSISDSLNPRTQLARIGSTTVTLALAGDFQLRRGTSSIGVYNCGLTINTISGGNIDGFLSVSLPLIAVDAPSAGTYTYSCYIKSDGSTTSVAARYLKLVAYEL